MHPTHARTHARPQEGRQAGRRRSHQLTNQGPHSAARQAARQQGSEAARQQGSKAARQQAASKQAARQQAASSKQQGSKQPHQWPWTPWTQNQKTQTTNNFKNNNTNNTNNNKYKSYCGNCGKVGHTYKKCVDAIISMGIILYNTIQINNYYEIKFLLIQRRDSIGFIELLRGKYQEKDDNYLGKIIDIMTDEERNRVLTSEFDELLDRFIINKNNRHYKYEYAEAKEKFNRIRNSGKLKEIIDSSLNHWTEPEWGFSERPKTFKRK